MLTDNSTNTLLITNEMPPRSGGAGVIAAGIVNQLGIKSVSAKVTNKLTYGKKIKYCKYLWLPELALRLLFLITQRYNSVIINDFGGLAAFYSLRTILLWSKNANIIFIHHGLLEESEGKMLSLRKILFRRFLSIVTLNVFVSRYIQDAIKETHGVDGIPYHFGWVVKKEILNYIPSLRKQVVQKNGMFKLMIVAGRINERKFPLEALDFLDALALKLKDGLTLRIAGPVDHLYKENILLRTERLKSLRVTLLGVLDRGTLFNELIAADVIANFSILREAAPTLGYEAAILNKPYIFFGEGGHYETSLYNRTFVYNICGYDDNSVTQLINTYSTWGQSYFECLASDVETDAEIFFEILRCAQSYEANGNSIK